MTFNSLAALTITVILFTLCPATGQAQAADTLTQQTQTDTTTATISPERARLNQDAEAIFLYMFAIVAVSAMAGAFAAGAAIFLTVILTIAALVTAGILSVSVLAGIYRRSFATGFKTFLLLVCSVSCAAPGILALWVLPSLFNIEISSSTRVVAGTLAGCAGGILLGFTLYRLLRITGRWMQSRIGLKQ